MNQNNNELLQQNIMLKAIFNSLSDGVLICNANLKVLKTNLIIPKWFKTKNNILRHHLEEFITFKDTINTEETNIISIKTLPKEVFEITKMPLILKDKDTRFIIIIRNISQKVIIQKLKENFVATLTHDLKVPLIAESNIIDFLLENKFG